ncbi:MAG: GAF domain-containing protein [Campylobacterales bacterium]|nr:GAF domain-containing protein [Campylobacterales bacterium]
MIEYVKELSKKEKYDNILECMKSINKVENCTQVATLLETLINSLVTAKYSKIWIYDKNRDLLCRQVEGEIITSVKDRGLLGQAFTEKRAFFVNDVTHKEGYQAAIDNIDDLPVKDMILYPILDSDDRVKYIFQAMTGSNNLQQFVKSDVETLTMLSDYMHNIDLSDCCQNNQEAVTPEEEKKEQDILSKIFSIFK